MHHKFSGMKSSESKIIRRRLRSSYITSLISITLVLFMLGLVGVLLLNAHRISEMVKESISFSVILKENVKEAEILKLQKDLDAKRYIKSTEYVPKDKAAKAFQQELGEDFVSFLGYNPLLSSIEVRLYADYTNSDSLRVIEKQLEKYDQVKEVYYQKSLVHLINDNVKKISLVVLLFCGLLFIIAVSLINNTIRLSIYSRRFLINTMKLVGATNNFIRKPFLMKSVLHGIYGTVIAIGLLLGCLYWAENQMQDIIQFTDKEMLFVLFVILLVIGILINLVSTYFAVNKFLKLKTDDLYY